MKELLTDHKLIGSLEVTAQNAPAVGTPTGFNASIIYIPKATSVSATVTYGQLSGFENTDQFHAYMVYTYKTIGGVKYKTQQTEYVEVYDDGAGGDYYKIDLTWSAVSGASGYYVYEETQDMFWEVTANSFTDTGAGGGTSGNPTGTNANYIAEGYTFNYKLFGHDYINELYSENYAEDSVSDDSSNENYIIKLDYDAVENQGNKVLIANDYDGYNYDTSLSSIEAFIIDNALGFNSDVSVTPTTATKKAIVANSGIYVEGSSIMGDVNAGDIVAESLSSPTYKGAVTHDAGITGTTLSMSGASTLPTIDSVGISSSDTYLHRLYKTVNTVVKQNIIDNTFISNSSENWGTATVVANKNTMTDSSNATGGSLYGVWNYMSKSGNGKLGNYQGLRNELGITSGGAQNIYGCYNGVSTAGTFDGSYIYGLNNLVNARHAGSFSNVGVVNSVMFVGTGLSGKTTAMTSCFAMNTSIYAGGNITATNFYGNAMDLQFTSNKVVVTNVYGFYYGNSQKTATVTNHYGMYLDDITLGTNKFSIYTKLGDVRHGDDLILNGADGDKLWLGAGKDMSFYYNGTDGYIKTDEVGASDLHITTGAEKTLVLDTPVYDDLRITPAGFDRAGISDPSLVSYTPSGSGIATFLYEFQLNDIAYFTVQLPHSYKQGTDITAHIHWTAGTRGNEENGATVGWKLDYSWANIDGTFGTMATVSLSDACDGTDHKHQMTPSATITGTGKNISSMLICNVKRTDTGTDDTWAGTASGSLPMLLEIDFHYQIDTIGSRTVSAK